MIRFGFLFVLLCSLSVKSFSQTAFDFDDEAIGVANPGWYQFYGYGPSSQKGVIHNGLDSMYVFYKYPSKIPKSAVVKYESGRDYWINYVGNFVNNLPDGEGKMTLRIEKKYSQSWSPWVYTGQFKKGLANGFGELRCGIRSRYGNRGCIFRGIFINGKPVEGIIGFTFHQQYKDLPTLYYSGQVSFKFMYLNMEGWGALLRIGLDHEDFEYSNEFGLKGGFYAGQFLNGIPTGFGLANFSSSPGNLGYLTPCLVGADNIFKEYDQLPITTSCLVGDPYAAGISKNASFNTVFPDYNNATYGELNIGNGIIYKGMVMNNLPYGLGYIEYPDKLRDISFWKNGEKIAWKDMLDQLLPDKRMTAPKKLLGATRACKNVWDKQYNYEKLQCDEGIYPMIYYGSVNEKGFPIGWGWKVTSEENNFNSGRLRPFIGYFNGKDPSVDKSGLESADSLFQFEWPGWNKSNDQNIDPLSYYSRDIHYFGQLSGFFKQQVSAMPATNINFNIIGISDPYFRKIAKARFEEWQRKKLNAKSAIKKATVKNLFYKNSTPAESYILASNGERIQGMIIPREQLTEDDYLYLDKKLYYVHMGYQNIFLGLSAQDGFLSTSLIPAKVLVFRGYSFDLKHKEAYCSGCSDRKVSTEGTTYLANVYSGRDETNVYQNNSGTYTVATRPIYTSIGIYVAPTAPPPCKVCHGYRKREKVPVEVIEW